MLKTHQVYPPILLLIMLLLAGCGNRQNPTPTATATTQPSTPTTAPIQPAATPTAQPSPTLRPTETAAPIMLPTPDTQAAIDAVRQALAPILDANSAEPTFTTSQAEWQDSCLGLPIDGMICHHGDVLGQVVTTTLGNATYVYHVVPGSGALLADAPDRDPQPRNVAIRFVENGVCYDAQFDTSATWFSNCTGEYLRSSSFDGQPLIDLLSQIISFTDTTAYGTLTWTNSPTPPLLTSPTFTLPRQATALARRLLVESFLPQAPDYWQSGLFYFDGAERSVEIWRDGTLMQSQKGRETLVKRLNDAQLREFYALLDQYAPSKEDGASRELLRFVGEGSAEIDEATLLAFAEPLLDRTLVVGETGPLTEISIEPTQPVTPATTLLEPAITAAHIDFAGWSPDGRYAAAWVSTQADNSQFPVGELIFFDVERETLCLVNAVEAVNALERSLVWEEDGGVTVTHAGISYIGRPCDAFLQIAEPPTLPPPAAGDGNFAESPDGRYRAETVWQGDVTEPTQALTTTIYAGAEVVQAVAWEIDTRIGNYAQHLGGEWVSDTEFLLYETLFQGPLLLNVDGTVTSVAIDLLGLDHVPTLQDDNYALAIRHIPSSDLADYYLLTYFVGSPEFPPPQLYRSADGTVETLDFDSLVDIVDGWLVLNLSDAVGGYERNSYWRRPLDDRDVEPELFAEGVDGLLRTADSAEFIWTNRDGVVTWQDWQTLDVLGQYQPAESFSTDPRAISPDGRYAILRGNNVPNGPVSEALFIVAKEETATVADSAEWALPPTNTLNFTATNRYIHSTTNLGVIIPDGWQLGDVPWLNALRLENGGYQLTVTQYPIDEPPENGIGGIGAGEFVTFPADLPLTTFDQPIERKHLIFEDKRKTVFYHGVGEFLDIKTDEFQFLIYLDPPEAVQLRESYESIDIPDSVVREADAIVASLFVATADEAAYNNDPSDLPLWSASQFTSTNGAWTATAYVSQPFSLDSDDPDEERLYQHRSTFVVAAADGSQQWVAADKLGNWGIGVGNYAPLLWTDEALYFTYRPIPGGCGSANGSDLWSLNLTDGTVEQLAPAAQRYGLHVTLSQSATRFATDTERGFSIRDFSRDTLTTYDVNIDQLATADLHWIPNSGDLLIVGGACCDAAQCEQKILVAAPSDETVRAVASVTLPDTLQLVQWLSGNVALLEAGDQRFMLDLREDRFVELSADVSAEFTTYRDDTLNFSLAQPTDWSATHQNGTTIFSDAAGDPQVYVREYLTRDGFYPAETLIRQILPPSMTDGWIADPIELGDLTVYDVGELWFVAVNGRLLSLMAEEDAGFAVMLMLRTLSADSSTFNDNYTVISNDNWIAEVRGGANVTETFTLQRRDGSAGYLLFTEPPTQGLGYDLIYPRFFDNEGRYLYHQNVGIADGCGGFGGGNLQRVDVQTGAVTYLPDTGGDNPTLSPDGTTVALLRGSELQLYTLADGSRRIIPLSLQSEQPSTGIPLWSPDGSRIAFVTVADGCAEEWTIAVIDLNSEEIMAYQLASNQVYMRHAGWLDNVLFINHFDGREAYIDLDTGEVTPERPSVLSNLDGLILRGPGSSRFLVQDNVVVELSPYALAQGLGQTGLNLANKDGKSYVVRNGELVEWDSAEISRTIHVSRGITSLYGIVGDMLIAHTFSFNRENTPGLNVYGVLTAIDPSSGQAILINDIPDYYPVVAPDYSRVIYHKSDGVFAYYADGTQEQLSLPPFAEAAISPDSRYIALSLGRGYDDNTGKRLLNIFDLESNQFIQSFRYEPIPRGLRDSPFWHPNGNQVALNSYRLDDELGVRFSIRLIGLDGSVRDFPGASFPVFSPDGNWMAVHRIDENYDRQTGLIHLATGEEFETPFQGRPLGWMKE